MKFSIDRDALLEPLQLVQGVVERRQTLPILANVLLGSKDGSFSVTATDMEVELAAKIPLTDAEPGEITVPARKFIDICRALPQKARVDIQVDKARLAVRCARSRFLLSTLPAEDYPTTEKIAQALEIAIPQAELRRLIELTQFAIAHQDVRYYLNGLLLEISPGRLRAVATDGHRLAMADRAVETGDISDVEQVIVPRKGVGELMRLLGAGDELIQVAIGANAVQIGLPKLRFTSKLIDGRFPDYVGVIPRAEDCDKELAVEREALRQSLARAAILSNEKYRAVRLKLDGGVLRVLANNPEEEEAEDELEVSYRGGPLEIGFNVSYLLDAVAMVPSEVVRLRFTDASSSCLITPENGEHCQYVVMPMRL